jgi:hypothetical protein
MRRYLADLSALMPGKRLRGYLYYLDTLRLVPVEAE